MVCDIACFVQRENSRQLGSPVAQAAAHAAESCAHCKNATRADFRAVMGTACTPKGLCASWLQGLGSPSFSHPSRSELPSFFFVCTKMLSSSSEFTSVQASCLFVCTSPLSIWIWSVMSLFFFSSMWICWSHLSVASSSMSLLVWSWLAWIWIWSVASLFFLSSILMWSDWISIWSAASL